jgi:hypothetical protein
MEAIVIDGAGNISTTNNTTLSSIGFDGGAIGLSLSKLLADNSNKFGLDARSLAADLSGMSPAQLRDTLSTLANNLTPVQQGELRRALDAQAPSSAPAASTTGAAEVDAPKPVAAKAPKTADPLGVGKILGAETAKLAALSPSLTADMKALEKAGWKIQIGAAGGGTSANRSTKTITIDKNEVGNAKALVQSLAHEVGHARYTPSIDTSSKAAYLRSTLADEGAATLSNIRAQREIIANGGADIGIAGNSANQKAYNAAYDAYVKSGDAATARNTIGAIYGAGERTSTTGQTYNDYYGSWYDKNFPATK